MFTPQEAADYLRGRLDDNRLGEADRLAADLGHLLPRPGAGGHLHPRPELDLRRLLAAAAPATPGPAAPGCAPGRAAGGGDADLGLSIELADTDTDKLAGVTLQLAAILDPNGIPAGLFTTTAAFGHYPQRLGREVDRDDTRDAVAVVYRLGLADTTTDPDPDLSVFRVHAFVQRVVRETTPPPNCCATHTPAHAAANALTDVWPDVERDTPAARLGQLLRANAATLAAVTGGEQSRGDRPGRCRPRSLPSSCTPTACGCSGRTTRTP